MRVVRDWEPRCCSPRARLAAARPPARRSRRPIPSALARRDARSRDASRARSPPGSPWHGRLENGVQLPEAGTDFDHLGPDPARLAQPRLAPAGATDALIVLLDARHARVPRRPPRLPPILIADLSRPQGGPFGAALRRARPRLAPERPRRRRHVPGAGIARAGGGAAAEVDRALAQDLVDRLPPGRAPEAFVGPHLHLRGSRRSSCRSSTTTTTSTCASQPRRRAPNAP